MLQFEYTPARKFRSPLCGPLGRLVGVFTLVCALGGILSRTSFTASSILFAQTLLPVTAHELVTCLTLKCNSTITVVGMRWSNPKNALLLKCLTHSNGGDSAEACWSADDTDEGKAVQLCAVCNYCAAGTARCTPLDDGVTPLSRTGGPRTVLPAPAKPGPNTAGTGGPGGNFDWSKYLGGGAGGEKADWMKYIPGSGAQGAPGSGKSQLLPTAQASVALPVVPSEGSGELMACIEGKCLQQSNALGVSWTNPVNTELAACLASSQNGFVAAVTCFPPVDPDRAASFQDSTALRYCALCSSCIAGDRGSDACIKAEVTGKVVHKASKKSEAIPDTLYAPREFRSQPAA